MRFLHGVPKSTLAYIAVFFAAAFVLSNVGPLLVGSRHRSTSAPVQSMRSPGEERLVQAAALLERATLAAENAAKSALVAAAAANASKVAVVSPTVDPEDLVSSPYIVTVRDDLDCRPLVRNKLTNRIDAVVTFVDPTDRQWKTNLGAASKQHAHLGFGAAEARFRQWNMLRFTLRSLLKFAPFVRRIYVVVASKTQVPPWLDSTHPRIRIVYHSDLFIGINVHLPTFNPAAIESSLHRIKGMSNMFLYVHSDSILGRRVELSNFITNTTYYSYRDKLLPALTELGDPCFDSSTLYASTTSADLSPFRLHQTLEQYHRIGHRGTGGRSFLAQCMHRIPLLRDRYLAHRVFRQSVLSMPARVPKLLQRCALFDVERRLPEAIGKTRSNRFRDPVTDINVAVQFEAFWREQQHNLKPYEGQPNPLTFMIRHFDIQGDSVSNLVQHAVLRDRELDDVFFDRLTSLLRQRPMYFSVDDDLSDHVADERGALIRQRLSSAIAELLPERAPWENSEKLS